jgi:hypothetical protein
MGTMQKTSGMQRLSLSESAVARLLDPRTGQRLRPLGVTPKGRIIWPMLGASPDDPSSPENEDEEGTDDDNPEGGKSKEGDGEGDSDKSGNPDAKIEDLEQEKERHYRRRKEAEKRAEELERELAELKGKDTPEQEKLQTKVAELESSNEALTQSLRESRLQVAFLKDNSYDWHNPGRALSLADLSEVEIDDDGKVHGLKKALDSLAKSDAYLIKEKGSSKDDKEKDDLPNTGGDSKNPSKKEKSKASQDAEKDKLLAKYPQLRR